MLTNDSQRLMFLVFVGMLDMPKEKDLRSDETTYIEAGDASMRTGDETSPSKEQRMRVRV